MKTALIFVHALSPLHPGTGQGTGVIDLPIAREKATGLPYLPGSTLKGVLRDHCTDPLNCIKIFGPDTDEADKHAGAAHFSDQRLLLLPIRSLKGTFAWVTSPYVLHRFARDAREALPTAQFALPTALPRPADRQVGIAQTGSAVAEGNYVYLEDLDLEAQPDGAVTAWAQWLGPRLFPQDSAWQQYLTERLCVVHDDVLTFLLDTATEVIARIRLDPKHKTVAKGGLWYEEALPTETVLAGIVVASTVPRSGATDDGVMQVLAGLTGRTMQLGGKATVGRGLCQVQLVW